MHKSPYSTFRGRQLRQALNCSTCPLDQGLAAVEYPLRIAPIGRYLLLDAMDREQFSRYFQEQMASAMAGRLDPARLENMRSTSIGGASLSTALVFLLMQTDLSSPPLQTSLVCAVVAIPAWIATWQMVEAYLFCGESSYTHFATLKGIGTGVVIFLVALLSLFIGFCTLLWHLMPAGCVLFAILCVALLIFVYRHNNAVRAWSDKYRGNGI